MIFSQNSDYVYTYHFLWAVPMIFLTYFNIMCKKHHRNSFNPTVWKTLRVQTSRPGLNQFANGCQNLFHVKNDLGQKKIRFPSIILEIIQLCDGIPNKSWDGCDTCGAFTMNCAKRGCEKSTHWRNRNRIYWLLRRGQILPNLLQSAHEMYWHDLPGTTWQWIIVDFIRLVCKRPWRIK